ncbi:hypothetical protein CRM22_005124 [Opisthorchis felineus]|uniref:PLAT domain-containing protein n=1 Tax=Opisthorchis felineus TaxID=147828 RepID=A0A4S2LZD1_OPIFE|nr:hypothetical protein CRM22_005124 [Opisthorchis felineus]
MAELATIIKEVAEQLVLYFNKRRLEVGWDDSNPKNVVTHLIPKPKLANRRAFYAVQRFPELRKLLTLLETEGYTVDEPKTEAYIKSALEECVSKMNFLTYQDLWHTLGLFTKPSRQVTPFISADRNSLLEVGDTFPPVTGVVSPSRRAITPAISKSSAERIINYASKMIANLLRLTKTAYIQQNERKSLGRHLSRPTDQKSPKQKKRLNVPSNESSTTQPLPTSRTATVNTPVFKLEHVFSTDRSDEDKLLKDQAKDTYHVKPKADGKNSKCTLFTRISTDTSSDFSGAIEKCKVETSKTYLGRPACKVSTSAHSEGGSDVDERKPANVLGGLHSKSAVKRNLRNLLPQTSFSSTKTDSNCWVHKSDTQDKQLRLPTRSTETNHLGPPTISEPIFGTSKHADVMSSKEIIQQARKYGTPNFVARMRNELRRAQTTSEPLEGYWIPRRHLYSFDLLKTKQETLKNGVRRLRSVPVRAVPLQEPGSLKRYRELSTGLIKPTEVPSSCAGEYALKKLDSATPKLSNAETSNSVHGCTSPLNSGAAPTDQDFVTSGQVVSDQNDHPLETSPKRKRSTVSRQVVHPVKKTGDHINSEQLKKLALVTANALTEALGIPSNDLKTQIVQGSGEAVVDSKPRASKVSRKMNRVSEEVKAAKDVKISDASTTSSADNVVYRVRVESVRHYRLQQADCYRDFYAPSTTHLPNPTPPMSIVLRGMNCSSPSLELVSAELARLGEVAGHTVILRDPQMLGRRSAGAKHVFGDVPVRKPLSPSFIATITNEGCPQVDYFAIVCSSLGKIIGVDIRPVPNGVKNSRYEWFIKKITIDELERQKKYHFSCDQWLTLEAKNIPCKRVRTSPKVKMMKKCATVSVPQNTLSHCSVPRSNVTQLLSESHAAGLSKTCLLKQASDFLPEVVERGPKALNADATCMTGSNGTACALRSAVESVLFQLPKIHTLLGFVSTLRGLWTDEVISSEEAGQPLPFSAGQAPVVAEVEAWASYIAEWYSAIGINSQLFVNQADFPDGHHLQPVHESVNDLSTHSAIVFTVMEMLPATRALFVDDVKSYPSFLRAICSHAITFFNDCDTRATRIGKIDQLPIPDLVTAIETCSPLPVLGINFATQCHTNIPRIASIQPYSPEYLDEPSDSEQYTYPATVISGRNSELERTASIEHSQPVEVYGTGKRLILDTEDIITPPENGMVVVQADLNSWSSTNELQQQLGLLEPVDPATVDTKDTTENRGPLQLADVYFDPNYSTPVTAIDDQSARNATQDSQCSNISLPFLNDGALEERLRQIAGLSIHKPTHSSLNGTDGQMPEYYLSSDIHTPIQEQDPTDKFELRHVSGLGDQTNENNRTSWISQIQPVTWTDNLEALRSQHWETLVQLSRSPFLEWDSELSLIVNQPTDKPLGSASEIRCEQSVAIVMHESML